MQMMHMDLESFKVEMWVGLDYGRNVFQQMLFTKDRQKKIIQETTVKIRNWTGAVLC